MAPWLIRALTASAIAVFAALPARASESPPGTVVEGFHNSLLGVMKQASDLGYLGRYRTLSPVLNRVFHLPVMTRIIAGRHWKKFTEAEKNDLVTAFSRMTTATYARRFDGFGGETFKLVGVVPVRADTKLVKTELVKSDGEIIQLNYMMRKFEGSWRVIDVHLKGAYSELATRRSEYASVLRREGLPALLKRINGKVAKYEKEAGAK